MAQRTGEGFGDSPVCAEKLPEGKIGNPHTFFFAVAESMQEVATLMLCLQDKTCSFWQGRKNCRGEGPKEWDEGDWVRGSLESLRQIQTPLPSAVCSAPGEICPFQTCLKAPLSFHPRWQQHHYKLHVLFYLRHNQPARCLIKTTGLIHTGFDWSAVAQKAGAKQGWIRSLAWVSCSFSPSLRVSPAMARNDVTLIQNMIGMTKRPGCSSYSSVLVLVTVNNLGDLGEMNTWAPRSSCGCASSFGCVAAEVCSWPDSKSWVCSWSRSSSKRYWPQLWNAASAAAK